MGITVTVTEFPALSALVFEQPASARFAPPAPLPMMRLPASGSYRSFAPGQESRLGDQASRRSQGAYLLTLLNGG